LTSAVDLVVMQCMRKRKKLRLVVCKPWCLLWQDSRAAFEFLRLNEHTNLFAVLRLDRHRRQANVFELGHKSGPNSSIFNQNRAGMVRACGDGGHGRAARASGALLARRDLVLRPASAGPAAVAARAGVRRGSVLTAYAAIPCYNYRPRCAGEGQIDATCYRLLLAFLVRRCSRAAALLSTAYGDRAIQSPF